MKSAEFGGKRNSFAAGQSHPAFLDLTGQRFGRWLVLSFATFATKLPRGAIWNCVCDCGTTRQVRAMSLRAGAKSCGCLQREKARKAGDRTRTHGMSDTSTYHIWMGMVQRCHNPNARDFGRYGARGIAVCERWRDSFENFLADMGERPAALTLDRIDNAKGYEPGNCRWATYQEQVHNSSAVRLVTINGRTQCITHWLAETGLSTGAYHRRIRRGWMQERALTTPPDKRFDRFGRAA